MTSNPAVHTSTSVHFQQEASELLQQIGDELQTLRQNFSIQKTHTLMRLTHTLKGAAATVGLDVVQTITQALENAFKALCARDASLTPTVEQLIFEGYRCLERLLTPAMAQDCEADLLDEIKRIAVQLQENLGDRFGQSSHIPSSAELGVDIIQSVFENGVTDYLDELENALVNPDPNSLNELLKIQAEVFIGLAESLGLPGFGNIAKATVAALKQHPENAMSIAQIALDDYRAGQTRVLQCDRTQGGAPSEALLQLSQSPSPPAKSWLSTLWQWLKQPIFQSCSVQDTSSSPNNLSLDLLFQQCHRDLETLIEQQHKPVLVKIKGDSSSLEETVINQLHQPLNHLVHNAFNHNIETPDIRQQQGKTATGKIQLAARRTDHHLIMCVWDDGYGANPEPVRQQVAPQLNRLRGTITAAHQPGKGTCFTLKVPV